MVGLQLELCQQAAKSFLREKLGKLECLGTMGAFTLGQGGGKGAYTLGQDLSAKHLTRWLEEGLDKNVPGHEHLQPPSGGAPSHMTKR